MMKGHLCTGRRRVVGARHFGRVGHHGNAVVHHHIDIKVVNAILLQFLHCCLAALPFHHTRFRVGVSSMRPNGDAATSDRTDSFVNECYCGNDGQQQQETLAGSSAFSVFANQEAFGSHVCICTVGRVRCRGGRRTPREV